jgi:TldD protein
LKDRLADALRAARADHTEIRLERTWATAIAYRGSRIEGATTAIEVGGMVRCLNRGRGWGVASFTGLDQLRPMMARAHELSLAVPLDVPIHLAEIPVRNEEHIADLDGDVRGVSLGEKRDLLDRLNQDMLGSDRRIIDTHVSYEDLVAERWVATSAGVMLYDLSSTVRLGAAAVACEESFFERAFESSALRGGWRSVQTTDHLFRAAARRAVALLDAPRVKAGSYTVVLDPRCIGALIHQGIGHLSEADTLAARPDLDRLMRPGRRIGSDLLTIGDDGSASSLPGSLHFDDEGADPEHLACAARRARRTAAHPRDRGARGHSANGQCQGQQLPARARGTAHEYVHSERAWSR